jgi:hypothetical protein
MDESTDESDAAQFAVAFRGMDMEFNITEEVAALLPMKWTSTGTGLHEIKKVLQGLDIRIRKPAELVTDGAPSMVRRNSIDFSLIADVKNKTTRNFII